MTVDPQFMIYVWFLSVWERANLNPHSLLASVKSCVGKSGLYGFSCRFWDKFCFICLNSLSSSAVHLPSQWLFSCVIYLRSFICIGIVGYQLCSTFIIPRNDWTCVFVVGGPFSGLYLSCLCLLLLLWLCHCVFADWIHHRLCLFLCQFFSPYNELILDAFC